MVFSEKGALKIGADSRLVKLVATTINTKSKLNGSYVLKG